MNEVDNSKVSSRKRLIEEIEAYLMSMVYPKQGLNPFLDRYVFLQGINSVQKFLQSQVSSDEFIEEFVSDIVSEDGVRLDETRQLFVIGNNGVGKSTFSSKLCNELRKIYGAEVQIIEANNKGFRPLHYCRLAQK